MVKTPLVSLREYVPERSALIRLDAQFCKTRVVIPISVAGRALVVAMADPTNAQTLAEIEQREGGGRIEAVRASAPEILQAIATYYEGGKREGAKEHHASAPEHAESLMLLCEKLTSREREKLAMKWIDRAVRVHTPAALAAAGYEGEAAHLRGLAALRERGECVRAYETVAAQAQMVTGRHESAMNALACAFAVMATIERDLHDAGPDLRGIIVGTVTAARCAGVANEESTQEREARHSMN